MFLPLELADEIEGLGSLATREHVFSQEEECLFVTVRAHRDMRYTRAAQQMLIFGRHDNLSGQRDRDAHRARQLLVERRIQDVAHVKAMRHANECAVSHGALPKAAACAR
jgi:hypothetical protein